MKSWLVIIISTVLCAFIISCNLNRGKQVVVYTSLDQIFSEPILREFEKETGIKVRAVYDVEATKTTGLVNRLIAEKNNPQADVFWNSEVGRTVTLKKKGVLAPYVSPSAQDIPEQFMDPEGYWAGFAARARVLIYNKNKVINEEIPESIFDLTKPKWKKQVALAYPLFGTTATHAAALFVYLGDEKAKEYFRDLRANEVAIVDGNSTAKDRVANGALKIGFTDTDDVNVALEQKKPVGMIFPDQDGMGTLLIPNTVALISGGPNPENGKKLVDYLLSPDVESRLAYSGSLQMPLRPAVPKPDDVPSIDSLIFMKVDFEKIADKMEESGRFLQKLFIR